MVPEKMAVYSNGDLWILSEGKHWKFSNGVWAKERRDPNSLEQISELISELTDEVFKFEYQDDENCLKTSSS